MAISNNERFGQSHRQTQSESQMINSETMENKDPAINQHQDDSANNVKHEYSDQENDTESSELNDDDDNEDPYFQKNAEIAQDLDDDLENKNASDDTTADDEDSDRDFDQKDTSDLQNDNFGEENDRNFSDPYIQEEEINPNIKEQDPLNQRGL